LDGYLLFEMIENFAVLQFCKKVLFVS
jgi:hypothetical protein